MAGPVTGLDGAILGILTRSTMSGYDLRKLCVTTPLAGYSDSPGSIYPALRRLETRGLITGRTERTSALGRRVYRATRAGTAAFREWVIKPPSLEEVEWWLDGVMLRFAFADAVLSGRQIASWLAQFERHLLVRIRSLQTFRDQHARDYDRCGLLALDAGIQNHRSLLEWARMARREFARGGT